MKQGYLIAAVVLLALLAGCAGAGDVTTDDTPVGTENNGTTSEPPSANDTENTTGSGSTEEDPTSSDGTDIETDTEPDSEPDIDPDNPFGEAEVDIYLHTGPAERDVEPLIQNAMEYWETNAAEYAGYNVTFTQVDSERRADIELTFQNINQCGGTDDNHTAINGCAEWRTYNDERSVQVRIQLGLTDPNIESTAKHELGHALGLDHDDEPQDIMRPVRPGLAGVEPVQVYVENDSPRSDTFIEGQAEDALEYYSDEDNVDNETLDYTFVDEPHKAHLTITYSRDVTECDIDRGGSCFKQGAYEGQQAIHVEDVRDHKIMAWHVGYMLAPIFVDERPEVFETRDYQERQRWPS